MKRQRKGEIWKYLESTGVLEKGSDEEIKAAKKAYRKKYFLEYKQRLRQAKPEFTVCLSKKNGEYERIAVGAKRHKMTVGGFIRLAALSYLAQTYIVPNREQLARLEQILASCLNEVKTLVSTKEKFFWQREEKLEAIEKRIAKMEVQLNEVLRHPPLLSSHDHQNQVA